MQKRVWTKEHTLLMLRMAKEIIRGKPYDECALELTRSSHWVFKEFHKTIDMVLPFIRPEDHFPHYRDYLVSTPTPLNPNRKTIDKSKLGLWNFRLYPDFWCVLIDRCAESLEKKD